MKRINLLALVFALACVVGMYGMVTGKIQSVIYFEDALNEIMVMLLMFMGMVGAIMNIKK